LTTVAPSVILKVTFNINTAEVPMGAFVSRARPVRLEPASGVFLRRDRSVARVTTQLAPQSAGGAPVPLARTQSDERLRWAIAAVAMGAFPVAGAMHLAFGISPAAYVIASVAAFGAFVASVTKK